MIYGPPVDAELYDAVTNTAGDDYAFSYLSKARQNGKAVEPFTHVAYTRLRDRQDVVHAFRKAGYTLKEPKHWHPTRDGPSETMRSSGRSLRTVN